MNGNDDGNGNELPYEQDPDAPQHAVITSNGRYYSDPATGELLVSVTNVLSTMAKEALVPAAAKHTAEWFAEHLPAAIRAAADPDDLAEFVKQAKAAYHAEWERWMRLGSRVHRQAQAINLGGAPIAPDLEAEPFVGSYRSWLADFGIDIAADILTAECTMLNRELGYGGTSDLWVNLRFPADTSPLVPRFKPRKVPADPLPTPSGLWLVDIKTSLKHPASAVWDEYPLQLAALRRARDALVCPPACRYGATEHHDALHEFPVPDFVGAAVLNLRTTGYGFIPLPADDHAFAAFRGLQPVTAYLHQVDLRGRKPIQPPIQSPTRKDA